MTLRSMRLLSTTAIFAMASAALAQETVSDSVIAEQRAALAANTDGKGFGPQAPRNIDAPMGENDRVFADAPPFTEMNLCNIHFHAGAEHQGGEFTTYLGNGDGKGYGTGFGYSGTLTEAELAPIDQVIGDADHPLVPGDTIEVHYVHTTAQVSPGPTLGACLSEAIMNPQLRVETQVYVLVNDESALDFVTLTAHDVVNGLHQAINIPTDTGTPVQYEGSTTGPSYNEAGSPLQVSWSVRPEVAKVNIATVATWFENNVFDEDKAHGVRNLVINPELLSPIE
ncbi:delta-class carbonic anhydrase [Marivita sp.]|uniref:delta-class carbonic anhydrase n=3 Tax=Marivita sp. TaxID=2003365 RepID=UPI003A86E062